MLEQYNRHVKPAFDYYIAPGMAHADLIVPRGGENEVAINLIVQHVQTQMDQVRPPTQLHILSGFFTTKDQCKKVWVYTQSRFESVDLDGVVVAPSPG